MIKSRAFKIFAAVIVVGVLALVAYGRLVFSRSFQRGFSLYHEKNYAAAEQEFSRAVFWGRNSGMAHAWLGVSIIEQTAIYTPIRPRAEQAFRHLDRAIKLGFNTHPIRFYRGVLFFNQGDWAAAKADFEAALRIKPKGTGRFGLIHAFLAQMYSPAENEAMRKYAPTFSEAGEPDIARAAEHARAATRKYLSHPYGWYLIAEVLGEAGAYDEALRAVAQAVDRGLDPASAAYARADILMRAGRVSEAFESASQAIAAGLGDETPGNRDRLRWRSVGFAHLLRARIYEARNEAAAAMVDYQHALETLDKYRAVLREENRYSDAREAEARAFIQDKLQ